MALTIIEQKVKYGEESICKTCAHNKVCRYMDNQPCIECSQYAAQERHGRWELKRHKLFGNSYDYVCSACGCDYALAEYNYCPHCGAKMDGDNHGNVEM